MPENVGAPGGTAELVGVGDRDGHPVHRLRLLRGRRSAHRHRAGRPRPSAPAESRCWPPLTDVTTVAPTLASMIGIGVGVDYALFIVTRHRDALARGLSVPDAAAEANATAGQSVVFAGGTVLLALSGLLFTGVPNFRAMGYAPGSSSCSSCSRRSPCCRPCSAWPRCGSTAARPGGPGTSSRPRRTRRRPPGWPARSAGRPVVWLVGSVVVLLALAAPALGMKLGNADAGNEPESNDHPPGLRPGGRGLRPRLQRAAAGRRGRRPRSAARTASSPSPASSPRPRVWPRCHRRSSRRTARQRS